MLERRCANNWAGGLGWSYYEGGTGHWSDYLDAQRNFSNAHPGTVNIAADHAADGDPDARQSGHGDGAGVHPHARLGNPATATAAAGSPTPGPACCTQHIQRRGPWCLLCPGGAVPQLPGLPERLSLRGPTANRVPASISARTITRRGASSPKSLALGRGWPLVTPPTRHLRRCAAGPSLLRHHRDGGRRGIIGGYPCGGPGEPCVAPSNRPYFRPGNNITRGQLSKLITLGWAGPSRRRPLAAYTFEDTPPRSTFFGYVETIVAHGIATGYPCGNPGEPCDRRATGPTSARPTTVRGGN